ncbi:hypothetical protein DMTZ50_0014 [Dehalococcoides mccartyi]|nr:hypothetical protein [Dehalococcoides mccartyi]
MSITIVSTEVVYHISLSKMLNKKPKYEHIYDKILYFYNTSLM